MAWIITNNCVYSFRRKGLMFWLVVLKCKIRKIEYEVIEE